MFIGIPISLDATNSIATIKENYQNADSRVGLIKEDYQDYLFNTTARICEDQKPENYLFKQEIMNIKLITAIKR